MSFPYFIQFERRYNHVILTLRPPDDTFKPQARAFVSSLLSGGIDSNTYVGCRSTLSLFTFKQENFHVRSSHRCRVVASNQIRTLVVAHLKFVHVQSRELPRAFLVIAVVKLMFVTHCNLTHDGLLKSTCFWAVSFSNCSSRGYSIIHIALAEV